MISNFVASTERFCSVNRAILSVMVMTKQLLTVDELREGRHGQKLVGRKKKKKSLYRKERRKQDIRSSLLTP